MKIGAVSALRAGKRVKTLENKERIRIDRRLALLRKDQSNSDQNRPGALSLGFITYIRSIHSGKENVVR